MRKFLLIIFSFFLLSGAHAQTVSINNTNRTPTQLADELLSSCIGSSNAKASSTEAVGYFENNGGGFPFKRGIVIRSGNANFSEGKYTGNNVSDELNTGSDQDLLDLITATGQNVTINEIGYLEFEFVAYSDDFNFNFIFASNEYGENQCSAADAMGAFLTDITDGGQSRNIAYLGDPKYNVPVSVNNVHDATDENCGPRGAQFIHIPYGVNYPSGSTINMRGRTKVLNASATTIPGHTYRIRLIVADAQDTDNDSAIFIDAGNFNTSVNLGPDRMMCGNEKEQLSTGLDPSNYPHKWFRDGAELTGENDSSISIDQGGEYKVEVEKDGCKIIDDVHIDYSDVNKDIDPLKLCFNDNGYNADLTNKITDIIGSQDQTNMGVAFYNSSLDAQNGENAISNPEEYKLDANFGFQTIYVGVTQNNCDDITQFNITENERPEVDALNDVVECSSYTLPAIATDGDYYSKENGGGTKYNPGDAITKSGTYYIFAKSANGCTRQTSFRVDILADFDVSLKDIETAGSCGEFTVPKPPAGDFYTATGGGGTRIDPGTKYENDVTIYYYAELNGSVCIDEVYTIEIKDKPLVDELDPVITCLSYKLPSLTNGAYYTDKNGNGPLPVGEEIDESATIYIYKENTSSGCASQSSFQVTIIPEQEDITECGSYILPKVSGVSEYEDAMGNTYNSGDTLVNDGNAIKNIRVTAIAPDAIDCNTSALSFNVALKSKAEVPHPEDKEFICEHLFYELPDLNDKGEYFTGPDRTGRELKPGERLVQTTTIYINREAYGDFCDNESNFTVTIEEVPPIPNFFDEESCGPFVLPDLFAGQYYTEPGGPNGSGQQLSPGDRIKSTQEVYIYRSIDEIDDCVNESSFKVTVKPVVQAVEDVKACDSYTLPPISGVGEYYKDNNGERGNKLPEGTVVNTTQTIYVYDDFPDPFLCRNEVEFQVTISSTPTIASGEFPDVKSCGSYTLSDLSDNANKVTYSLDNGDPLAVSEYTIEPGNYTVYVRKEAQSNPDCFVTDQFALTVFELPTFTVKPATICKDVETEQVISKAYLDSGIDPGDYQIEWYLNGKKMHEGPDFNADKPGEYTVKTTQLNTVTPNDRMDCNYAPATVNVDVSAQPVVETKVTTKNFAEKANIKVTVIKGYGDYVFQLDNTPFQSDNVFRDVSSGIHTVTVKGALESCGETVQEVQVIKYPKFFTPNNDGYNDTWNIDDLADHPEAKIDIFDRYGKSLAQIYPDGTGWDGTYNGREMPSNDYWFEVHYEQEGKPYTFVSHFTLKR